MIELYLDCYRHSIQKMGLELCNLIQNRYSITRVFISHVYVEEKDNPDKLKFDSKKICDDYTKLIRS